MEIWGLGQSRALWQLPSAVEAAEACLALAWHDLVKKVPMLVFHNLRAAEARLEAVASGVHLPAQSAHCMGQQGACGPGKESVGYVELLQVLEKVKIASEVHADLFMRRKTKSPPRQRHVPLHSHVAPIGPNQAQAPRRWQLQQAERLAFGSSVLEMKAYVVHVASDAENLSERCLQFDIDISGTFL